jgi:hypothetical protein
MYSKKLTLFFIIASGAMVILTDIEQYYTYLFPWEMRMGRLQLPIFYVGIIVGVGALVFSIFIWGRVKAENEFRNFQIAFWLLFVFSSLWLTYWSIYYPWGHPTLLYG